MTTLESRLKNKIKITKVKCFDVPEKSDCKVTEFLNNKLNSQFGIKNRGEKNLLQVFKMSELSLQGVTMHVTKHNFIFDELSLFKLCIVLKMRKFIQLVHSHQLFVIVRV